MDFPLWQGMASKTIDNAILKKKIMFEVMKTALAIFEEREVRRSWHDNQWYFSVADVVRVLTDSADVKQYIKKIRARDLELSVNWGTFCTTPYAGDRNSRRKLKEIL
ncbi:MAG: hypothetical protein WAU28_01505 [Candidatus Moraniibacteriota bacterium]